MTRTQKHTILACFLGWALDAFDFFLLVFVLKNISASFNAPLEQVSLAVVLTLAMRPLGALLFGRLADRFGRRPMMMVNIAAYSLFAFFSGLAPNLAVFIIARGLFGIAMGGEWGISSALTMESIPVLSRGWVSGLLQAGYPTGYLLASAVYGLLYAYIGWRGMLMVGIIPACLILYVRRHVSESPAWVAHQTVAKMGLLKTIKREWKLVIYAVVLMTLFNFFSHGTQDMYPTFLQVQHHFSVHMVSIIAMVYSVGAILGGLCFGKLSEYIGRKRSIFVAALLVLPLLPLWAFSTTPLLLALGAFGVQFMVQGAWGVIPAYLNELSPGEVRATFPGLVYQLGNLLASGNAAIQIAFAQHYDNNYALVLAVTAGTVALLIAALILRGRETQGISLAVAT